MLAKTGLLVVSNPKRIGRILSSIQQKIEKTLYIQLLSSLSEPLSFRSDLFTSWAKYSKTIWGIYSEAATYCQELDVRVLLSVLKYKNLSTVQTHKAIDLIILDKIYKQNDINYFLQFKIKNVTKECDVVTLSTDTTDQLTVNNMKNEKTYNHSVLRGTFDRLHTAHKILLSEAALRSASKVTVGVTKENMLQGKTLWELIEPIEVRVNAVQNFLTDICPELHVSVVPITDTFGPTQHDLSMDLLIVSTETIQAGQKINKLRQRRNLPVLDVLSVELIGQPHRNSVEEEKISSSTVRRRLLGTLLKPPKENKFVPRKPFVIGLTGGIASGKSGIAQRLKELGADVFDCDKIAHDLYEPDKPCYALLVKTFGKSILSNNGKINRKALSSLVFKYPGSIITMSDELKKFNSLLWPTVAEELSRRIKSSQAEVVVIETALLLTAGRDKFCHEIWTTLISQAEAVRRLQIRNGLTEEEALCRIACQCNNQTYIEAANVVFCSQWSRGYTYKQVDKAWALLQARLRSNKYTT